ncbi:MAG: hypothetical protein AAGK32_11355, partial [Actinomycetota bacterium]
RQRPGAARRRSAGTGDRRARTRPPGAPRRGPAYRRCLLSDDELRRGVADGSLVEDDRLARRLADLGVTPAVAP